jgi:iron complex outermembrane receptor protein
VNLVLSAFHYRLAGLIVGVPVSDATLQYRNVSSARATGFEAEVNGHPTGWLELAGAFSAQHSRGNEGRERLENSPPYLAHFRASVPLVRDRLLASFAVRYLGARLTAYADEVPPAAVMDMTVTATRIPHLDLQIGVRNLLDRAYSDPLSSEHATRLMPAAGRSLYVRLVWRSE